MKETKKERKRTRMNQRSLPFAFCGPTFFALKVLGQIFLVHLEAALNLGGHFKSYFTLGKALTVGPFQPRNVTHSHLKTKKSFSKSFSVSSWWMPYCIESFFSKGLAHKVFTLHQLTAHNYVNPQSTFCVCICNSNLMVL